MRRAASGIEDWGRPQFQAHPLIPMTVALESDLLVWSMDTSLKAEFLRAKRPPANLLSKFVGLNRGPRDPERLVAFATKWGVLGICPHGLPHTHELPDVENGDRMVSCLKLGGMKESELSQRTKQYLRLEDLPLKDFVFSEPVEIWWSLAAEAEAILAIAGMLRGVPPRPGLPSQWARILDRTISLYPDQYVEEKTDLPITGPERIAEERSRIVSAVGEWLSWGRVMPVFMWPPGSAPTVSFIGGHTIHGLFGALAWQLALALGRRETQMWLCSGCGLPFSPSRRPRVDQRRYCSECRAARIPERDRQRTHRLRKAE